MFESTKNAIPNHTNLNTNRQPSQPPHAHGHPILGNLPELKEDRLAAMQKFMYEYDDLVALRFLHRRIISLNHPSAIKHVLQDNNRNYMKVETNFFRRIFGNGLPFSSGDFWLKQRRLMQPAFHRRCIEAFGTIFTNAAESFVEKWRPLAQADKPIDVAQEMTQITLQVVGNSLFGLDLQNEAERVGTSFQTISQHMRIQNIVPLLLPWLPTSGNRRFNEAVRELHQVTNEVILRRREELAGVSPQDDIGEVGNNLLSLLMLARDEETGEGMSDQQLHDEVLTLLLAGHETTSTALSWTWYLLSQHPDAAGTLRAELATVLNGRPPTIADAPQLPYAKMVIQEAMRLYPPVRSLARISVAEDEILGYRIPARTNVMVGIYAIQRHPDYWEAPDEFRPERFAADAQPHHKFTYLPFGSGPRLCIGNNFALLEAQMILTTMAQHYAPSVVPGHSVEPDPAFTIRPKGGLPMILNALT